MTFRKGDIFDLKSILHIENVVFNKPYWTADMLKKLLRNYRRETIWVLENQNEIIGYLIEQRCDNEISILNVAIDRPFKNKSMGKKLVNKYLDIIPSNCTVFLEVNRSNFIAIKIYTDLNFIKINERKNYYKNGEDALVMRYSK